MPHYRRSLLRFSIKDMILATTLIAAGATVAYWSINWPGRTEPGWRGVTALFLWWTAGAIMGAGALWPVRQSSRGAMLGLLAQFGLTYMLIKWWLT